MKKLCTVCFAAGMIAAAMAGVKDWEREGVPREHIEWLRIWVESAEATDAKLPRFIMIGDSISGTYGQDVCKLLKGAARGTVCSGSRCVGDPVLAEETKLVLSQYKYDVVHVNNGLHGWKVTEEEYGRYLADYVDLIRKLQPQAKIVWAQSTGVRKNGELDKFDPRHERVLKRNALALEVMKARGIEVNDLFAATDGKPELFAGDGIHYNGKGKDALVKQVAEAVKKALGLK